MKIIKKFRLHVLFGFLLALAVFFIGQNVIYSSSITVSNFDLANYPGMCSSGYSCNGSICNVTLHCCAIGESAGTLKLPGYTVNLTMPASCADATAPTVIINIPADGSTVSNTVDVTATASDNVGVYQVKFYIDGTFKQADTASPYYYTWYTTSSSEGSHVVKAVAYDAAGNSSSATATVTVQNQPATDATAPTVIINIPADGSTVSNTVDVTATASDNVGVYQVKFYIDGTFVQADTSSPYNYTWYTTSASEGSHDVKAVAYDAAGNSSSATATVTVQNASPTACTSYTYSAWGTCVSGQQSRTIATQSPSGCTDTSSAVLVQTCTIACTSYDYSGWGTCLAGSQVRTIVNKYPAGCNDESSADLTQTCVVSGNIPCTGYTYSSWSGCKSTGKQERTITATTPASCTLNSSLSILPVLSQSCTVCVYSCGEWGSCNNGIKTRTCPASPSGCVAPDAASTIPLTQTACTVEPVSPNNCSYTYSSWTACINGKQTRTVTYKYPAGCTEGSPLVEQSCVTSGVACTYKCADWGACSTAGIRSRTCTKTPDGCTAATTAPATQETCPACAYAYGEWKPCNQDGKQTRDFKQSPDVCYQKEKPITEKTCTYAAPACSYAYSGWSACGDDGIQARTYTKTPAGCSESAASAPVLKQTCVPGTPGTCNYNYSEWNKCSASGKQTRTIVSKTPNGCKEGEPLLEQNCEIEIASADDEKFVPSCEYTYSAWSDCVNGRENRMVVSRKPAECRETLSPVLNRVCKTETPVKERPSDSPDPEPRSVFVAAVSEIQNLNGKTSEDWQKYYFGSGICKESETCSGLADPDNDGLINNEEYRFGTDPKDSDTDSDGHVDGEEIEVGTDPLVKPSEEKDDEVVFENPKETGEVKDDLLEVVNVETIETVDENKGLKISGKALPDTYVTIYIYSDPIVLTVKTDSDGNWSYVLEDPVEEGTHEVYVAVTDGAGKITAKSSPLTFVQTAEAASVVPSSVSINERTAAPSKARLTENYLIFAAAGLGGLLLALAAIGMLRGRGKQ